MHFEEVNGSHCEWTSTFVPLLGTTVQYDTTAFELYSKKPEMSHYSYNVVGQKSWKGHRIVDPHQIVEYLMI